RAWAWAEANPAVFFYNSQSTPTVGAGDQEVPQAAADRAYALNVKRAQAALYLFEATGTTSYRDVFDAAYANFMLVKSGYADGSRGEEQATLLEYTRAPNATSTIVQRIKSTYLGALQTSANLGAARANADPYLAYLQDYYWGSNQVKSDQGNLFYDV